MQERLHVELELVRRRPSQGGRAPIAHTKFLAMWRGFCAGEKGDEAGSEDQKKRGSLTHTPQTADLAGGFLGWRWFPIALLLALRVAMRVICCVSKREKMWCGCVYTTRLSRWSLAAPHPWPPDPCPPPERWTLLRNLGRPPVEGGWSLTPARLNLHIPLGGPHNRPFRIKRRRSRDSALG